MGRSLAREVGVGAVSGRVARAARSGAGGWSRVLPGAVQRGEERAGAARRQFHHVQNGQCAEDAEKRAMVRGARAARERLGWPPG